MGARTHAFSGSLKPHPTPKINSKNMNTDSLIEAALLTQNEAVSELALRRLADPPLSEDELAECLALLQNRWQNRALILTQSPQGWRFQIAPHAFEQLGHLHEQRTPRYSRAVMETLAIIAYQQPVTRGDIEAIRGVTVSQTVIQTLQERGWVEVIGHRDAVGKPALWATTDQFLADLQLKSLADLPPLTELGELVLPDITDLPNEADES